MGRYFPDLPARPLAQMGDVNYNPVHLVAESFQYHHPVDFLWGRSNGTSGEHPKGLALDHSGLEYGGGVSNPGPMRRQLCIAIADRMWRNRRRLGVWYVIWDRKISSTNRDSYAYNGSDDFWAGAAYRGSNPHTDHVHTSFYAADVYQPPKTIEPSPPQIPEKEDMPLNDSDLTRITTAFRAELQATKAEIAREVLFNTMHPTTSGGRASVANSLRHIRARTWNADDTHNAVVALTALLVDHIAQGTGLNPEQLKADIRAATQEGVVAGLSAQADEFAQAVLAQLGEVEVSEESVRAAIEAVLREGVGLDDAEETA